MSDFRRPIYISVVSLFAASVVTIFETRDTVAEQSFHGYIYTLCIVFFLFVGVVVPHWFMSNEDKPPLNIELPFYTFLTVLLLLFFAMFVDYYLPRHDLVQFVNILISVFLIFNLYVILYNVLAKPLTSKSGFMSQLFFFIPCMVTDGLKYLFRDVLSTPGIVFLMILLEIGVVILYFLLPWFITRNKNRIDILPGLLYLNRYTSISNSNLFHVQRPTAKYYFTDMFSITSPSPDMDVVFNRSYSLSFWAYINPTYLTSETAIFNYGGGKPALYFVNDEQNGYYVALFTNVNAKQHAFTFYLPNQKWNYFVFSYTNSNCEFYVNGELRYICEMGRADQPTYAVNDTMSFGEDNGLYGSVCNVSYFLNPLSYAEIVTTYNLLANKNPPIFITTDVQPVKTWYDYFKLNLILKRNNTITTV